MSGQSTRESLEGRESVRCDLDDGPRLAVLRPGRSPAGLELPQQWLAEITDAVCLRIEEHARWVTVEGLAEWLGCNVEHVYDLRQRGLPAHRLPDPRGRLSKKLYFSLSEVAGWLERESLSA